MPVPLFDEKLQLIIIGIAESRISIPYSELYVEVQLINVGSASSEELIPPILPLIMQFINVGSDDPFASILIPFPEMLQRVNVDLGAPSPKPIP
jgi:hypothetical protein